MKVIVNCCRSFAPILIAGMLISTNAIAADVMESEPNDTLATAQNVDDAFTLSDNPDIVDPQNRPWVSISATGDGSYDYFSFVVPSGGVTGYFDIDYGYEGMGVAGSVDTYLCLFAADGDHLAGDDVTDDVDKPYGAGGSTFDLDSYLEFDFLTPGTYVIGVAKGSFSNPPHCTYGGFDAGSGPDNDAHDATYELQISLTDHEVAPSVTDTDGDGVLDDTDNCPYIFNPEQEDFDQDGIGDACDKCPDVPNPDQADADGDGQGDACVDADGDQVIDTSDECWYTELGAVVNGEGCSIAQLCPAENSWKNHGSYVQCVAHASGDFVANGFITGEEKGAIVSEAASSEIGKNH